MSNQSLPRDRAMPFSDAHGAVVLMALTGSDIRHSLRLAPDEAVADLILTTCLATRDLVAHGYYRTAAAHADITRMCGAELRRRAQESTQ